MTSSSELRASIGSGDDNDKTSASQKGSLGSTRFSRRPSPSPEPGGLPPFAMDEMGAPGALCASRLMAAIAIFTVAVVVMQLTPCGGVFLTIKRSLPLVSTTLRGPHPSPPSPYTAEQTRTDHFPFSETPEKTGTAGAGAAGGVGDFFQAAGNYRCPPVRYFTRAEVATHTTQHDLWVVVDGNVLDVSTFVDQHPGGEVLLDGAGGQDMAPIFAQFHHPSSVMLFPSFCIGRIRETDER